MYTILQWKIIPKTIQQFPQTYQRFSGHNRSYPGPGPELCGFAEVNAPRSDPKPKQKIKLTKLRGTHKVRGRALIRPVMTRKALVSLGELLDSFKDKFSL